MHQQKQEYVKPLVTRLEYTVDVNVTTSGGCKSQTGSGAGGDPCSDFVPQCSGLGS
ncbi:MAG: hypothetical protein M3068_03375 [Gemmatimonadota bacterium]|nr:hypothetical protein [Gemmatimonadota bacterium]